MPWIKCIPPTEVEEDVKGLISDANVLVLPEADIGAKVVNGPPVEVRVRWRGELQDKEKRTELN